MQGPAADEPVKMLIPHEGYRKCPHAGCEYVSRATLCCVMCGKRTYSSGGVAFSKCDQCTTVMNKGERFCGNCGLARGDDPKLGVSTPTLDFNIPETITYLNTHHFPLKVAIGWPKLLPGGSMYRFVVDDKHTNSSSEHIVLFAHMFEIENPIPVAEVVIKFRTRNLDGAVIGLASMSKSHCDQICKNYLDVGKFISSSEWKGENVHLVPTAIFSAILDEKNGVRINLWVEEKVGFFSKFYRQADDAFAKALGCNRKAYRIANTDEPILRKFQIALYNHFNQERTICDLQGQRTSDGFHLCDIEFTDTLSKLGWEDDMLIDAFCAGCRVPADIYRLHHIIYQATPQVYFASSAAPQVDLKERCGIERIMHMKNLHRESKNDARTIATLLRSYHEQLVTHLQKGNVLILCSDGQTYAPALVITHLMLSKGCDLPTAVNRLRRIHNAFVPKDQMFGALEMIHASIQIKQ